MRASRNRRCARRLNGGRFRNSLSAPNRAAAKVLAKVLAVPRPNAAAMTHGPPVAWAQPARVPMSGSQRRSDWRNARRLDSSQAGTHQMAGLLTGLPALCANGLLSGLGKHLKRPQGFYSALHILLVLGFMALGRIRRPEGLRHIAPGEFGKVIGLDRVPEVRTLREKIAVMATTGNPGAWMKEL